MTEIANSRPLILAVDDNAYTLRLVEHALRTANFKALAVMSGEDALQAISSTGLPDLAIVDLHMPGGISGFELCHSVHQFSDLPVIMLTAAGDEGTILEGLEKHAEDYVVKPFTPGELVARVNRILGRMGRMNFPSTPQIQVDDHLRIDFPGRHVLVDDEPVSLTPTEAKLLHILLRQAGEVVTTDYILRRLWPGEPAFEDRLHVHLHRLRRKLSGDKSQVQHDYIASERGKGYMFLPQVSS